MSRRSKRAVTLAAALLLSALYGLIFFFSGQDGGQSGALSLQVVERVIALAERLIGRGALQAAGVDWVGLLEMPVRKLAHLSEYTCMGILVYVMWRPWRERDRRLYILVLLWVFFSASLDELHQRFVPGRCGCLSDVLLDTAGGILGAALCVMAERIVLKKRFSKKGAR